MNNCFVIQPFDKSTFDKRYTDIFEPAIINAGLKPYRVDRDPSIRIPIEEIEKKITDSKICFAEITTDNPNVWYELGFAMACSKDVVMISCDDERKGKFPFDIQHKHIITYTTDSISDYVKLKDQITEKIKALLSSSQTIQKIYSSPLKQTEGLEGHEVALLLILMENIVDLEDYLLFTNLKEYMAKAGYTDIATSVSVRTLSRKRMIEIQKLDLQDSWGNDYTEWSCKLTMSGEDWILNNQHKIKFIKAINNEDDTQF